MMKHLAALALTLAVLAWAPVAAWAVNEHCTADPLAVDHGPIITLTGDCQEGPPPDNDDIVIYPDDSVVTMVDNLVFGADGSGIVMQDGSTFRASAVDQQKALRITVFDGQDEFPPASTNVAVLFEAGSHITLQSGYGQWGVAVPTVQAEFSADADTVWVVDQWVPCGSGSAVDDVWGTVGGAGDCATDDQEYSWCLLYTLARNDPNAGVGPGATYLGPSFQALQTDWMAMSADSSMDDPHVFPIIGAIDKTPATYEVCIDTRQQFSAYGQANADKPLTERAALLVDPTVDMVDGATCIDITSGVLTASGHRVGNCFWPVGSENVFKIAKTVVGTTCAGGGGGDSVYLSDLNPMQGTFSAADDAVITPLCWEKGTQFGWLVPVSMVNGDTTYADDEAIVLVQSTNFTANGLVLNGVNLQSDQAYWNPSSSRVHVIDSGPVTFTNMSRVDLDHWTKVGGDVAGGNAGFVFSGITGQTTVKDTKCRYSGDWCFTTTGSAMGPARFERVGCEMIGHTTATSEGCIKNDTDWSDVRGEWISVIDGMGGTVGASANAFASQTNPMILKSVLAFGTTRGGLFAHGTGTGIRMYDLLGRGIVSNRAGLPYVGLWLDHFDVRDYTAPSASHAFASNVSTLDSHLANGVLVDAMTHNDELLGITEGSGSHEIRNVSIHSPSTDNVVGTSDVILVQQDSVAATTSTLEWVTITWDEAETTTFDNAISVQGDDGTETEFNFSSVLVSEMNGGGAANYVGVNLDADISDELVNNTGGNICVGIGTPGGGTWEPVANVTGPILGLPPDLDEKYYVAKPGSLGAELGCGAKNRGPEPGITPNGNDWLYRQVGGRPPGSTVIQGKGFVR